MSSLRYLYYNRTEKYGLSTVFELFLTEKPTAGDGEQNGDQHDDHIDDQNNAKHDPDRCMFLRSFDEEFTAFVPVERVRDHQSAQT